ncbi:filamentous hemagglutinin N-terminal domain-containing protein [Tropicimonas sp. IMCC6043]|uniref:two-partner secretion domain-containing protein n=1 Tax=Tropicimonas sp. IMCC6043 TaxID=2510645 RepID=UPI0013E9DA7E|nr:filamentous hemagglutinin N-terminal domain-containing protein [Tropicimonas sp. IMCC6043]
MTRPLSIFGSLTALLWATTALAQSLPTGGTVAAGSATISQPSATQMAVNQASDKAIVNWDGFSVGADARLDFNQPSSGSVILNRVTGSTTSEIHGQLNANGQVHLVNPNGIYIGPTGHVSAAGFVASTLAISNEDFLNGALRYGGSGNSGAVENAGTISIVPGGYAALIGGRVSNSGVIRVPLGKVGLGAGEQVTLDVSGDGFLQVAVPSDGDNAAMDALVSNSGRIEADGGIVHLKAASARDAARRVVNMSGVIEARSVGGVSGAVVLGGSGGAVRVSGKIDTSAQVTLVESSPRPAARPETGGSITITGEAIQLAGATLDASGAGAGSGGSIRVGGDYQGSGDLQRASITSVDADTRIVSDGGVEGDGGTVIVWSDDYTQFAGGISARGGDVAGNGGLVEVSGKALLSFTGLVDTLAPQGETGTLLLDPFDITIVDSGAESDFWVDEFPAGFETWFMQTEGSVLLASTIETALATTNVEITTEDNEFTGDDVGNIVLNAALDWMSGNTLALRADNNITLNRAINAPNGGLILTALGGVGTIAANAAVNVADFYITDGFWQQVSATLPGFSATDFAIDFDADFLRALGGDGSAGSPYRLTDIYGVQGMGGPNLFDQNFTLANDINASGTTGWNGGAGFVPVGFDGTLNGNRHAIDGLFIDGSLVDGFVFGGLFSLIYGTVQDLSITNANVSTDFGGILAGDNSGEVSGVMTSGSYLAYEGTGGGLVGYNYGDIYQSYSTADVSVRVTEGSFVEAGGLVAVNYGLIEQSNSSGSVDAIVNGTVYAGGLVGRNFGDIEDAYSLSNVSATNFATSDLTVLGGLVGSNDNDFEGGVGFIARTFSTGTLTTSGGAPESVGGLIGENDGFVEDSFWDFQSSGRSTSAGPEEPLSTNQLQDTQFMYDLAIERGWISEADTDIWAPGGGGFYPALMATSPVVFAIPNNITVQQSDVPTASTTGVVYGGPSVYRFYPAPDSLNTSPIFASLSFASDAVGTTPFSVDTSGLTSANGRPYRVVALEGTATITPDPVVPPVVPPVDEPIIEVPPLPNIEITPTIDTTISGGGTVVTDVARARAALLSLEDAGTSYEERFTDCASQGEDVSQYLSCLADATEDYADDLETLAETLPPGLDRISDIVRDASAGIREVGANAERRLSLATTVEERAAIRREAGLQARNVLRQAQQEIRKEIALIRATDPELASVQRQQIETVMATVEKAEISLSRAIGL